MHFEEWRLLIAGGFETTRRADRRRAAERARRRRFVAAAVPFVVLFSAVTSLMVLVERGVTISRVEVEVAGLPVVAQAPELPEAPEPPRPEPREEPRKETREEPPPREPPPREAAPRKEAAAAPAFDAGALGGEVEGILAGYRGRFGAVVYEPRSGERVEVGGSGEQFFAASVAKLPALLTLYKAAARGEVDLDERISIQPQDVSSYGTGELHKYPVGSSVTLRECAWYLVNQSDNTAWAMLNRRLGAEKIRAELGEIGARDTNYEELNYLTTPDDVLLMLEKISDPSYTNERLSREMLDAMTETAFEDRIPAGLPEGTRVAHKIGSYEDNVHDAGIVFYKDKDGEERRYYVVVMGAETVESQATFAIREVARAAHEAVTRPRGKETS